MRLRTSDSSRYPGFSAYIVCYAERSSKSAGIAPEGMEDETVITSVVISLL